MSPLLKHVTWIDLLDILLVAFLIYQLYKLIKGTVAIRIFLGIFAIYLMWKIVEILKMKLLSEILGQFIGVGVIALIIVFQQEIRKFLLVIGTTGVFRKSKTAKRLFTWSKGEEDEMARFIPAIVTACQHMSSTLTGALMVISRSSDLSMIASTGDKIDARISNRLIENIFFKNSPMHDGALIIEKGKLNAARCVLPATERTDFPSTLGMRHRAAVGITENTDALVVIVSEQTGDISFAKEGQLQQKLTPTKLREVLLAELS